MKSLCVLITNHSMCDPGGSELYVSDLAKRLAARGHRPVVYSTRLGRMAEKLLQATIPVIENLDQMGAKPDIIHCQHTLTAATALMRFPDVPAVYVCHDWAWHCDTPPRMRRIRRVIAVDQTVAERVIFREGRRPEEVQIMLNGIDLAKFRLRTERLSPVPRRALVFSNYMEQTQIDVIDQACDQFGITLDAAGKATGCLVENPEDLLPQYDIVFAKGRCAWEAIASGAAVIVCDIRGVGGMVRSENLAQFAPRNFGRRLLRYPLELSIVCQEIGRYDSIDAANVSRHVRETADLDRTVDQLLDLYFRTIKDHAAESPSDLAETLSELCRMLAWCDRTQGRGQSNYQAAPIPSESSAKILRLSQGVPTGLRKRAV